MPVARSARAVGSHSGLLWSLVGGVLLAPVAIGAVPRWAWCALSLLTGVLLAIVGWRSLTGALPVVSARRIWLPLLSFSLVLAWALLQAAPITPVEWHHPIWKKAAQALEVDLAGAVSLNPDETVDGAIRLATYAGIFYIALTLGRDATNADRILRAVALGTGIHAAYGLVAFLSGTETILWFAKTSYRGDLTGTFVNRNSYATFAGLGLLCCLAVIGSELRRARAGQVLRAERWRPALDYLAGPALPYIGAAFLLGTSLFLSHSRAGLASTLAGSAVLGFAYHAAAARSWRHTLRFGALFAGLALLLVGIGRTGTLSRILHSAEDAPNRLRVFETTISGIADRPLLGTGLGTFPDAFRLYRTEDIRDSFHQAHNTFLELALELGIPGASLFLLGLAALPYRCVLGLLRRRRQLVFPCLGLAATSLAALHSLVDFSLQIPAIAALYALIMGVACSQSWSGREDLSTGGPGRATNRDGAGRPVGRAAPCGARCRHQPSEQHRRPAAH